MSRDSIDNWIKHGHKGVLLGNINLEVVYGPGAYAEVYWIEDNEYVGVQYPDNARMVSSLAQKMYADIKDRFEKALALRKKEEAEAMAAAEAAKPKLKLNLKKPVLKLKSHYKDGDYGRLSDFLIKGAPTKPNNTPQPDSGTPPSSPPRKGGLVLKGKARGSTPTTKPKLALKSKLRSKR